jgi:hypothetical protein
LSDYNIEKNSENGSYQLYFNPYLSVDTLQVLTLLSCSVLTGTCYYRLPLTNAVFSGPA